MTGDQLAFSSRARSESCRFLTIESLAGRAATLRLRGFSQGELIGVKEDFASFLSQLDSPYPIHSTLNRADYARIVTTGGFPEPHLKPDRMRRAWSRDYVQRILEKDVGIFPRNTQPSRLRDVLSLPVANHSGELVYSCLANDLDVSMPSVKDSIDALQRFFLLDTTPLVVAQPDKKGNRATQSFCF